MTNVAIFASGSGSNAAEIISFFEEHCGVNIELIVCNNPDAGILNRKEVLDIPKWIVKNKEVSQPGFLLKGLHEKNIDFIVLAGFLRKIPAEVVRAFPDKIINIHPALLPKYGGKGMYGGRVHKAVFDNEEKVSGITIHYVNEAYDEGSIIFQAETDISACASPQQIADAVLKLEHYYYPRILNQVFGESADLEN